MMTRGLALSVLAVAACLLGTGSGAAAEPPSGESGGARAAQTKPKSRWVRSGEKVDDDFVRARLAWSRAVQEDLGLTAEQVAKIRDSVAAGWTAAREFHAKSREILPVHVASSGRV